MKSIKYITGSILVTLILLYSVLYLSCKHSSNTYITCLNGGILNTGKCICPTGFKGTYCETKITYPTSKYIGLIGRLRNWHHSYDNYGVLHYYNDTSFSIKVINDTAILGMGTVGMVNDILVYSYFDTAYNCLYFDISGFQYLHSESLIYSIKNDSIYTQECYYGSTGGYGCNIYNTH